MKNFHKPATTQWVSWGTTVLLIITAVTPVLPPGTPLWVTHALLIAATVLAVVTTRLGDTPREETVRLPSEDGKPPDEGIKPPAATP